MAKAKRSRQKDSLKELEDLLLTDIKGKTPENKGNLLSKTDRFRIMVRLLISVVLAFVLYFVGIFGSIHLVFITIFLVFLIEFILYLRATRQER